MLKICLWVWLAAISSLALGMDTGVIGRIYPEPQKILAEYAAMPVGPENVEIIFHPEIPSPAAEAGRKLYRRSLQEMAAENPGHPSGRLEVHVGLCSDPAIAEKFGDRVPELPEQGYAIRVIEHSPAGAVVAIGGSDARGIFYGLASLRQLLEARDGQVWQNLVEVDDFPVWPSRFVSDYFSNASLDGFQFLAANKIGGYGGLGDSNWRKPEWWEQVEPIMRDMKAMSDADLLTFLMQFHIYATPAGGPKFNIADRKQIDEFIECCRKMAQHGVSIFMIGTDDSTPRGVDGYEFYHADEAEKFDNSVGRAHGYLMKCLYEALHDEFPDVQFGMIGAPYSFDHGIGRPEVDRYLIDWAAEAPEEVMLVWTGSSVFSPRITRADAERLRKLVPGHDVFVFDNSNGLFAPMPRWNTEFYPGMEKDNRGIVFLLGLVFGSRPWETVYYLGACDYLWNPAAYDAVRSYDTAIAMMYGPQAVEPVNEMREALVAAKDKRATNNRAGFAACYDRFSKAFEALSKVRDRHGNPLPVAQLATWREILEEYQNAELPELAIRPAAARIELDGRIGEEEWRGAAEIQLLDRSGRPDPAPVTMKMAYADGGVYLAFEVPAAKPLPEQAPLPHDSPVYLNPDAIEFLLQFAPEVEPAADSEAVGAFAHCAFDLAGNRFDEYANYGGHSWDGDWTVKTAETPAGWSAEVFLKPSDLKYAKCVPPREGTVWRGNFHRVENRTGKVQSWMPAGWSFHQAEYFGIIDFIGGE